MRLAIHIDIEKVNREKITANGKDIDLLVYLKELTDKVDELVDVVNDLKKRSRNSGCYAHTHHSVSYP